MAPSLLKRQALRTRNGLAHLAGLKRPEVAQTPRDLVWQRETARLWRYRSDDRSIHAPLLIVHSLVSKSYILDLQPENSMIRYLVGEGFDVYLLDWEPAGPADAENTLETYAAGLIPSAIAATGADELTLMGYCFGGDLALLTAAAGADDLPIRNLVALTTPCDFHAIGFLADMFRAGRLDADDVIDDTGLVPAAVMDAAFQSIKPTDQLVQPLNLWEQLWSAERAENFLAQRLDPRPGAVPGRDVPPDRRAARPRQPPRERRAAVRRRDRAPQGHQAAVPEHLLRAGHDRARAVGRAADRARRLARRDRPAVGGRARRARRRPLRGGGRPPGDRRLDPAPQRQYPADFVRGQTPQIEGER